MDFDSTFQPYTVADSGSTHTFIIIIIIIIIEAAAAAMSKRNNQQHEEDTNAEPPPHDSDSDSLCDTEYSAAAVAAAASRKKVRGPQDPKNNEEAQDYLDAKVAAASLCHACVCRDRAHMAVDRFVDLLASVPVDATIHEDGHVKIVKPRREAEEFFEDPAYATALCVIGDCYQIDRTFDHAPSGCTSRVRFDSRFGRVASECSAHIRERRVAMLFVPNQVLAAVDEALESLPSVLVDIVTSYMDIAADFIDRPFVDSVYSAYVGAIWRFVIRQQAELRSLEMPSSALRSMFDGQRGAAAYNVLAVIDGVCVLTENHPNGVAFAAIAETLRDNVYLGLGGLDYCDHTILEAKSTRAAMLRRSDAVLAEEARLRSLGFDVALQLF